MFAILALDISRIGWSRWRLDRLDLRALVFRNSFEQERPTVEPLAEKLDVAALEPNDAPVSVLSAIRSAFSISSTASRRWPRRAASICCAANISRSIVALFFPPALRPAPGLAPPFGIVNTTSITG